MRRRIEQRAELPGGTIAVCRASGSAIGIAAIRGASIRIHPARTAELLFAEQRSCLARLGARAIAQTGKAIGTRADPAAAVQVAQAGSAGGMATGVVLGANVPAGAIGVAATRIRARHASEPGTALAPAGAI